VTDASSIRVVLDPTAIRAYATSQAADVGEVIRELADEGACFGVPTLCLLEAAVGLGRDRWELVGVLLAHSRCVQLESPPAAPWRDLAAMATELGGVSRGLTMWWADDCDGYVLTAEPDAYGPYDDRTIGI
jgi:hypothetical protein